MREEQEAVVGAGEKLEEDPDSGINVAMHTLADMFASEPTDGPTTALAPTEPRRSKRARRPTTIAHAKLGGGSI